MADVNITVTIPGDKVAEFGAAFLALHPKPDSFAGNDLAWVRRLVKDWLIQEYRNGRMLALQAEIGGEDVITES